MSSLPAGTLPNHDMTMHDRDTADDTAIDKDTNKGMTNKTKSGRPAVLHLVPPPYLLRMHRAPHS